MKTLTTYTTTITKTLISIITILSITTACSSVHRRHNLIQRSLVQQNITLELIKTQRKQLEITNLINENERLRQAEVQLVAAIDSIIKSNKAIQTKLPSSQNKKGGSHE